MAFRQIAPGGGSAGAGPTGAGSAGAGKPGAFISKEEPLQKTSPSPGPTPLRPVHTDVGPEGENTDQEFAAGLHALVAQVRRIRPEWSTRSIRRALAHPDVTERGWDRARHAMLAVAADPESHQPGRLAHDGPWWNQTGPAGPGRPRPPWCGQDDCDQRTRRLQRADGADGGRCPRCHPLRVGRSTETGQAPETSNDRLSQTAVSARPGAQLPPARGLALLPPAGSTTSACGAPGAGLVDRAPAAGTPAGQGTRRRAAGGRQHEDPEVAPGQD